MDRVEPEPKRLTIDLSTFPVGERRHLFLLPNKTIVDYVQYAVYHGQIYIVERMTNMRNTTVEDDGTITFFGESGNIQMRELSIDETAQMRPINIRADICLLCYPWVHSDDMHQIRESANKGV